MIIHSILSIISYSEALDQVIYFRSITDLNAEREKDSFHAYYGFVAL